MSYRNVLLLFWTIACWPSYLSQAHAEARSYYPYPREGVVLGQGWNSVLELPTTDVCVDFQEQEIAAHETRTTFNEIYNRYHLDRLLKVSASASYKGGIGSASGSASYSKQTTVNQNNNSILATISVLSGSRFAAPLYSNGTYRPIALSAQFSAQVTSNAEPNSASQISPVEFLSRCGDSFVAYIEKGGELNSVFTFSEAQRKVAESFALSLKASGFGASGSLAASGHSITDEQNRFVDIDVIQLGGPRLPTPVDAKAFAETIRAFTAPGESDEFEEKAFRIAVIPYTRLHNGSGKGRRAEFLSLFFLQSLFSELRDSYEEIITDYEINGGIVDATGAYASDANAKFAVLGSSGHAKTIGDAVDEWRTVNRQIEKLKPETSAALASDLRKFTLNDTTLCGRNVVQKYPVAPAPDQTEAAIAGTVPKYLVYLEAKRIEELTVEIQKIRAREALRKAVAENAALTPFQPIMDNVFSGTADVDAAALRAIDACLKFADEHPWSIDQITLGYHDIEATLLLLEDMIDQCFEGLGQIGSTKPCTDSGSVQRHLSNVATKALGLVSGVELQRWQDLYNQAGAREQFWFDFAREYDLDVDLSGSSYNVSSLESTIKGSLAKISQSNNPPADGTLIGPARGFSEVVIRRQIEKLCNDRALIPCYDFAQDVSLNEASAAASNQMFDFKIAGQISDTTTGTSQIQLDSNLASEKLNASVDTFIEQQYKKYVRYLNYLPLPLNDFKEQRLSPPDPAQYNKIEMDLNRFVYKSRMRKAVTYICSIVGTLRMCTAPMEAMTENIIALPPLVSNERVSHRGCIEWAERSVLHKKRDWYNPWGKDKYRTEKYCAKEGDIVDAFEFVRAAAHFNR